MNISGHPKEGEVPIIRTPDTTTNQNMWAFVFTEIQRIHTEELNPIRLKVYAYDSKFLVPYKSVLKTLSLMFSAFLHNDFPDEKNHINNLFDKFDDCYNKAESLKKSVAIFQLVSKEVNSLYCESLKSLELIDNMLEIIRQKKGFGVTEQVNFVINERASKALRINNNINAEILKLFRENKKKRKDYIDNVSAEAKTFLDGDKEENDDEEEIKDDSVSNT